ncbi:MAG: 50S ribosomal protein L6 [Candidatus Aminicenantales bacterium]
MSRIGKRAIPLPEGVKVNILPDRIEFEGKKGRLASPLYAGIQARTENHNLVLTRSDDSKTQKTNHGLCRSLASNAIIGVSAGFAKQLEIVGVGYRAKIEKDKLELSLGYSKPIIYPVPKDVEIVVEKPTLITVRGIDKQRVGQVAADIKKFRSPDPYKLKGIRYVGEKLLKKERKAGVTGA